MSTATTHTRRSALLTDRPVLLIVLGVALLQGVLYLALVPPWQHYDEPTHFEYALLFARLGRPPVAGDEQREMRLAIARSMQEHDFYRDVPAPDLQADYIDIGIRQFDHPPGYYALVSLPLRLTHHLDIVTQLYVARCVSLLLFLITAAVAVAVLRELTPDRHVLRLAVPLALVLLPAFADVMTAVNNDAGAVAVAAVLLWGAVRTIRLGLTWWRVAWLLVAAVAALLTKNTAAVLVLLVPLVLLVALWVQRGWSWRWLGGGVVVAALVLLVALLGWGDAAHWYRWNGAAAQHPPTQIAHPDAPFGAHVLLLEAVPGIAERRLVSPLLPADVPQVAGQRVTLGGWLWAEPPGQLLAPGVASAARPGYAIETQSVPVTVTSAPAFVAWSFDVPPDTAALHYVFSAVPPGVEQSRRVFLDGAVLVVGSFPPGEPPHFDDASARSGTWGGQRFTNLLRNPSAEQVACPRLRPWVGQMLDRVVATGGGRTPAQLLAALCDVQRSSAILARSGGWLPLDGMVQGFAWGHVRLGSSLWVLLFRGVVLLALPSALIWFILVQPGARTFLRPAVVVLALAVLLVWGMTMLRVLPQISEGFVWPVARYTFPAIIPTMLLVVGGWWALWPRRSRSSAVWVLVAGMALLNGAALLTIWSFYG